MTLSLDLGHWTPRAEYGQVWRLGKHRLMCGDCTDKDAVAQLLAGAAPECILADPPYSSGGFQESGRSTPSKGTRGVGNYLVTNDRLSTRGYQALLKAMLVTVRSPVCCYIFTDWRMWITLFDVVESSSYGVRQMIVWDKGYPGLGMGWRAQHELILCATKQNGLWGFSPGTKAQGNVISLKRQRNSHHPTQKPVELLELILDMSPFAATVYDPFIGSGSSIIAATNQGRVCYGMEIEPSNVDIAIARWEYHTGEVAECLPHG